MGDLVTHVTVNVDSMFEELRKVNQTNANLKLLTVVTLVCTAVYYSDSKKQRAKVRALLSKLEELEAMKGEPET